MSVLLQEIWRPLLENAPNIILVVNQEGTIQYINRTVPGLEVEKVIGTNQFDYIDPEHHQIVKETIDGVFRTGQVGWYEIVGTGADGGKAWYSTSVGPIRRDGEIMAVSLFTTDVTDRKRAEQELQKAKDALIAKQSRALQELSTPVIQVWDGILVLPLVGAIDDRRAKQIVENLLNAVVERQATVVIMDVTGVPIVDTRVAAHFLQTIGAAKMLGAEVILTGVGPQNAQTLVRLGVDLRNVATKGSLQGGLKQAFELTHRKVVDAPL